MADHSPEPWKVEPSDDCDDRFEIDHSGNGSIVGCDGLFEADASRIVACVNACKGIPTDWLEKYGRAAFVRKIVLLREDDVGCIYRALSTPLEASEKLVPVDTCKECGGFLYPREE